MDQRLFSAKPKPLRVVTSVAAVVILSFTTACSKQTSVTITKEPMNVSTKHLEDIKDTSKILKSNEEAITSWSFGCKNDIAFDITQKDLVDPDYIVSIKPKSVKVQLTAPITIYISKNAPTETVEHENAHVNICKRVYEDAEKIAKESVNGVFDRTFQASGPTVEAACANAVETISDEICQSYHLRTVEKINRVSEILDDLEVQLKDKPTHDELVDMAFSKYREFSSNSQD